MKSNRKTKTIILIILGIFFAFLPLFINNPMFTTRNRDMTSNYRDEFDHDNLKISAVSGKIHINNNWSAAEAAGICTGNGTYSEPYVIEDLIIDIEGSYGITSYGIWIENSDMYFKIENCTVYDSHSYPLESTTGIRLNYVDNGRLIDNNLSSSGCGIHISYGKNNTLSGNTAIKNRNGIRLVWSENNTIMGNNITNNNLNGVLIYEIDGSVCQYNTIFNNNFIGNLLNAQDNGTNNRWDNGMIGNFWDDYVGIDSDNDGVGDTPYFISGSSESRDNLPIWELTDNYPPIISIISPAMNDTFGINAPDIEIMMWDHSQINATWYTINEGLTNYTFSGLTGTLNQSEWDAIGHGEMITIRIYANDSLGYIGFKDATFWKDLVPPKITIISPTPNQLCGVVAPSFSLAIDDPNIQIKCYSLNGRPNITFTTETQFSQSEWNNIGNGTVLITFYVEDKAGNMNSSEIVLRKDANIPDITIISPIPSETFGNTPPDFNISIIEDDLVVSMWYTVQGSITQYPITGLTGTIDQDAWNEAPEGDIAITFCAQDRAGNIGTEIIIVKKSIPAPPTGIFGIIPQIIGSVSALLVISLIIWAIFNQRKRKKARLA